MSRLLGVPLADVSGVVEFYSLYLFKPTGKNLIQVCTDVACRMRGGEEIIGSLCEHLGVREGEVTPDGIYSVQRAPCLGLCEHAPAALVGEKAVGQIDPKCPGDVLDVGSKRPQAIFGGTIHRLTGNCGQGRPMPLAEYELNGGYQGLRKALSMKPEEVIAEVKKSGLVGRGGAAFPTGVKWEGAAEAQGEPKYVVCNADESEPGTFKDRGLMEEDPHLILEGMIIAGYAIGANKGYIYIRGEYPYSYLSLSGAVEDARQNGHLGRNILGSSFAFDVEIRQGAGAYICGEETALFELIEGKRGYPRLKPPFPTVYGLFGKPTVINNVETLCNIPFIIAHGSDSYREIGTEKSPGSKLFCLSGDIRFPGIYEVPFGISLNHLLFDLAGGIREDRQLQAILFGGAAGAFAVPEQVDVEMSFEALRDAGLPLGSGVVLVLDESRDIRQIVLSLARFFAHESCGKCYPCQMGTQRQLEILQRVVDGKVMQGDVDRLKDVGWTMTDASICGLGQTAASAVLSALRIWPDLFSPENKENRRRHL